MPAKHNGLIPSDRGDTTMQLLDSTDSDVEWLSLPPIKGKKPKKKKTTKQRANGSDGCYCWSFLKTFLLLMVVGLVSLLTFVTVWLSTELTDVREKLGQVESRSMMSVEDVQKLYTQMSTTNKSLEMERKTLNQVLANISSINTTISKLSETVDKLSVGLKSAPELKQLPDKLQAVSKSLAAMGSDVSGMKDTVDSVAPFMKDTNTKFDSLNKQITDLQKSPDDDVASSVNDLSPDLANLVQKLPLQLQDINTTVSSQISVMMKSLSQYEERFIQLENLTNVLTKNISTIASDHTSISTDHTSISTDHASMTQDFTSDQFKSSVADIVNSMLANMGTNVTSSSLGPSHLNSVMANITSLIDEMEKKYTDLAEKSQSSADGTKAGVSSKKLHKFESDLQSLNETMLNLKSDVKHMGSMLVKQSNDLTNLTHHVTATQGYVSRIDKILQLKLSGQPAKPPESVTQTSTATTATFNKIAKTEPSDNTETEENKKTTAEKPQMLSPGAEKNTIKSQKVSSPGAEKTTVKPPVVSSPGAEKNAVEPQQVSSLEPEGIDNLNGSTVKTTEEEDLKTSATQKTEQPPTVTESRKPAIVISRIKNVEDLKINFARWIHGSSTGQVDYASLSGYLGPDLPNENDLQKFDADHNGTYSLQEFANALGFKQGSSSETQTTKPVPPR